MALQDEQHLQAAVHQVHHLGRQTLVALELRWRKQVDAQVDGPLVRDPQEQRHHLLVVLRQLQFGCPFALGEPLQQTTRRRGSQQLCRHRGAGALHLLAFVLGRALGLHVVQHRLTDAPRLQHDRAQYHLLWRHLQLFERHVVHDPRHQLLRRSDAQVQGFDRHGVRLEEELGARLVVERLVELCMWASIARA